MRKFSQYSEMDKSGDVYYPMSCQRTINLQAGGARANRVYSSGHRKIQYAQQPNTICFFQSIQDTGRLASLLKGKYSQEKLLSSFKKLSPSGKKFKAQERYASKSNNRSDVKIEIVRSNFLLLKREATKKLLKKTSCVSRKASAKAEQYDKSEDLENISEHDDALNDESSQMIEKPSERMVQALQSLAVSMKSRKQSSYRKEMLNQELINQVRNKKVYFLLPNFSSKFQTFFSIDRVNFLQESKYVSSLEIVFNIQNTIILKILRYDQSQKATHQGRSLKRDSSRMKQTKEKLKESIFQMLLLRGEATAFYQLIVVFLKNNLTLVKSYLGTSLKQIELMDKHQQNQSLLLELLKVYAVYYLIVQVHEAHYLIKCIKKNHNDVSVLLMYEIGAKQSRKQPGNLKMNTQALKTFSAHSIVQDLFLKSSTYFSNYSKTEGAENRASQSIIELLFRISANLTHNQVSWRRLRPHSRQTISLKQHMVSAVANFLLEFSRKWKLAIYKLPHTHRQKLLNSQQKDQFLTIFQSPFKNELWKKRFLSSQFHEGQSIRKGQRYIIHLNGRQVSVRIHQGTLSAYFRNTENFKQFALEIPHKLIASSDKLSAISKTLSQYTLQKSFIYSKFTLSINQRQAIIHRSHVKLFNQFYGLATIYSIDFCETLEYRIYIANLQKSYILQLEYEMFDFCKSNARLKQIADSIRDYLNFTYFRQHFASKCTTKRRKELSQQLKHVSSLVWRSKKRQNKTYESLFKVPIKWTHCSYQFPLQEEIISKIYRSHQANFFITIRHDVKFQYDLLAPQKIEIAIKKEGFMQMIRISEQIDNLQICSPLNYHSYRSLMKNITQIIDDSRGKMCVLTNRIRKIIKSNSLLPQNQTVFARFHQHDYALNAIDANHSRRVQIIDNNTFKKWEIVKWEMQFASEILFINYNRRVFRRMIKCVGDPTEVIRK